MAYWADILKSEVENTTTLAEALGDWTEGTDPSYMTHLGTSSDPHGSSLTQTVKVRTPLVDSSAALSVSAGSTLSLSSASASSTTVSSGGTLSLSSASTYATTVSSGAALTMSSASGSDVAVNSGNDIILFPASGKRVIVGDTTASGTFRPVVISDQAYQTITAGEALKIIASPVINTSSTDFVNIGVYPQNTTAGRRITVLTSFMEFLGSNYIDANTECISAHMHFSGSAAFPAPSSTKHLSVIDLNLQMGSSFSGSIHDVRGILLHAKYDANATGTIGEFYMLDGYNDIHAAAGKITTFAWVNLPAVTNATNFYHIMLGDVSGSYSTRFKTGSQSANIDYVLPTAQGAASTYLKNDGSGNLSWVSGTDITSAGVLYVLAFRDHNGFAAA